MGIQGLLGVLKDIQTPTHVSKYRGQTLGIDGYVWLHRGAYGCAEKLVKGIETTQYINYAMHRIRMLRHHGVVPYVVFDGDRLPSKSRTEEEREARRQENLDRVDRLMRDGRNSSAFDAYAKCIDITPEMAYQLIKALKAENIDFVVAPYEADAQLAYLEKHGVIDAVVTEDSDLLVFGCKKVLYKLDSNGQCIEVLQSRFTACKSLAFAGWTTDLFRQMAILSGCDYLPSIPGMGLKNAHKMLVRYKSVQKVLQAIRLEGKLRVPPEYQSKFEQAEKTFLYQRVWDPRSGQLTTLSPLENDEVESALAFIGPFMATEVAMGIATGLLDPISRKAMVDIMPSYQPGSRGLRRQRSSSPAKQPAAGLVPKGQKGLADFFSKAPVSHKRTPLAPKDINVPDPANAIKSVFFGGKTKGLGSTIDTNGVCTSPPPSTPSQVAASNSDVKEGVSTQISNSSASPISGIGDYFCELDGADPRLLLPEEEGEAIPAFANLVSNPTLASFDDAEDAGRTLWQQEDDHNSDVSETQTTPAKSQVGDPSSHFSSPMSDDASMSPFKPTKRTVSEEDVTIQHVLCSSPKSDLISSPIDALSRKRPRPESPTSPLKAKTSTSRIADCKSPASDDEVELDSTRLVSTVSLWEQFGNTNATPLAGGSTRTSRRTTPALKTPASRPMRLYFSDSPVATLPFAESNEIVHRPALTRPLSAPSNRMQYQTPKTGLALQPSMSSMPSKFARRSTTSNATARSSSSSSSSGSDCSGKKASQRCLPMLSTLTDAPRPLTTDEVSTVQNDASIRSASVAAVSSTATIGQAEGRFSNKSASVDNEGSDKENSGRRGRTSRQGKRPPPPDEVDQTVGGKSSKRQKPSSRPSRPTRPSLLMESKRQGSATSSSSSSSSTRSSSLSSSSTSSSARLESFRYQH